MLMQIVWFVAGVVVVLAGLLAHRFGPARIVGRVAIFVLFAIDGGLVHVIAVLAGIEKTNFYVRLADTAYLQWVTLVWQEVFVPHEAVLVSLMAVLEVAIGLLVLVGGRATRIALVSAMLFYLTLSVLGTSQLLWALAMVPSLALLLRAEAQAASVDADRET